MSKVIFDGERQLIIVNPGENFIEVRRDLYSVWKEWVLDGDNSKYKMAFKIVGGNSLPTGQLGLTYFLLDGWKIRPYEGDHRLTIKGNIYRHDGSDPIEDTIGDFKVTVSMTVSNLIDIVNSNGSSVGGEVDVQLDPEVLDGLSSQEEWTITAS
jgi:hypothetical protein